MTPPLVLSAVLGRVSRAGALLAILATISATNAQTLNLNGVKPGPTLPAANASTDLGGELESEAKVLFAEATRRTAEAKAAVEARARLRALGAFLLQNGATRPWVESAPTVAGMRVVGILKRADALIAATLAGNHSRDGKPLTPDEAKRAIAALDAIARMPLDRVRTACATKPSELQAQLLEALAVTLAPLAELCQIVEGLALEDPWPVVIDARAERAERLELRASIASLRVKVNSLPPDAGGASAVAAITSLATRGASSLVRVDLRLIDNAADTLFWLHQLSISRPPRPMPDPAIRRAIDRIALALDDLAHTSESTSGGTTGGTRGSTTGDTRGSDPRQKLAAIETIARASRTMIEMREDGAQSDASRTNLSDASSALLGAELSGDERARARVASRIEVACAAAKRLQSKNSAEPPRDLKDVIRVLDKDARFAVQVLPAAFAAMSVDPSNAADPAVLSAIDRVTGLDIDRTRIERLQTLIDQITGLRPKAGRAFVMQARRMSRMLLEPLKRTEAQAAFASLEAQTAQAFPLPYEEELKRRTDRALVLTGGRSAELIESAGRARAAWADAVGRGDFGGAAAERLDRIARLLACLRDLDQLDESISREQGDRLAMWGGWASRRAALAPAAQDLVARSVLSCQSMLAPESNDASAQFDRDVNALERAIPLVRLVAQLERKVAPLLAAPPDSLAALLAPIILAPAPDSYLVREWPRLAMLDRALLESEFARRTGDVALRDSLSDFLASLAKDVFQSAFGSAPTIVGVPGFDGTQPVPDPKPTTRP